MTRTTLLDGPWTLRLATVGDLGAAVVAGEARVAIGLAQPAEGARIGATGPPAVLRTGAELPASLPGCVHLDLMAAGLLADPFTGMHESEQHWIARCAWTYATVFDAPPARARQELVLGGVATTATAWLNGQALGEMRNEHRTYRFEISGLLRPAGNRLELRFDAQADRAEALRRAQGPLPSPYTDPINAVRTVACAFGWDWGPTLVTAAVWEPIRIDAWSDARLMETRLSATAPGGRPHMRVSVVVARQTDTQGDAPSRGDALPLRVEVRVAGAIGAAELGPREAGTTMELDVPGAERWWPRSHGEPRTYPAEIVLLGADGTRLDSVTRTVGFRDVALIRAPDEAGESFALHVNGERVWVRGANWIPDDPFPVRVTPERVAARVEAAVEAGMDLLRVWGGGRYESDAFYAACDRAGVLVWQDFLFACAAYPEDPETFAEVEAEAREAIARLGSHPSLALWNGGNETIWGWFDWGWPDRIGDRAWGLGYWLDLLPRLTAELDPDRPYWANTPWSGSLDRHPNDDRSGTSHLWEVWNDLDYIHYRDRRPRFAAEYGYQAPATWRTMADAVGADALTEGHPAVLAHQKAGDGRAKLRRGLDRRFPDVVGFDDWHFLTQLEQARAMRLAIGHLRSLHDHCSGSVIWQLNDTWPAISWSLVDAAGRRKPAWYAVRDAYRDRLLTIEPALDGPDGALDAVAINDRPEPWRTAVTVRRLDVDGTVRRVTVLPVEVAARSAVRLPVPPEVAVASEAATELLTAEAPGAERATWWDREDHELRLPVAAFDASVRAVQGGAILAVTARTLVRELCCFPDRLDPDARVDRMAVTLLPGERAELRIECPRPMDPARLVSAPVLRAANDGTREH